MKKILTILGLASVLTLGVGGAAGYVSASAQESESVQQTKTWDVTETFDSVNSMRQRKITTLR